jgi:hypothetical protein
MKAKGNCNPSQWLGLTWGESQQEKRLWVPNERTLYMTNLPNFFFFNSQEIFIQAFILIKIILILIKIVNFHSSFGAIHINATIIFAPKI